LVRGLLRRGRRRLSRIDETRDAPAHAEPAHRLQERFAIHMASFGPVP